MKVYAKHYTVCGLRAQRIEFNQHVDRIDITRWGDPEPVYLAGPSEVRAEFVFLLGEDDIPRQETLFPLGGGSFHSHYLGSSDVCLFCGTAWLPGTFFCPNCGGSTNHFTKGLEYRQDNSGIIVSKSLRCEHWGYAELVVEAHFSHINWKGDDPLRTFEHDLWGTGPALWVCRFCGYVVKGHTANCPGCGGNRAPIEQLATQRRLCVYCGREFIGNYACDHCNTRLMAVA